MSGCPLGQEQGWRLRISEEARRMSSESALASGLDSIRQGEEECSSSNAI